MNEENADVSDDTTLFHIGCPLRLAQRDRFWISQALQDARRLVSDYVIHYNEVRLHSIIGYVTPLAKLEGRS